MMMMMKHKKGKTPGSRNKTSLSPSHSPRNEWMWKGEREDMSLKCNKMLSFSLFLSLLVGERRERCLAFPPSSSQQGDSKSEGRREKEKVRRERGKVRNPAEVMLRWKGWAWNSNEHKKSKDKGHTDRQSNIAWDNVAGLSRYPIEEKRRRQSCTPMWEGSALRLVSETHYRSGLGDRYTEKTGAMTLARTQQWIQNQQGKALRPRVRARDEAEGNCDMRLSMNECLDKDTQGIFNRMQMWDRRWMVLIIILICYCSTSELWPNFHEAGEIEWFARLGKSLTFTGRSLSVRMTE